MCSALFHTWAIFVVAESKTKMTMMKIKMSLFLYNYLQYETKKTIIQN